MSQPDQGPPAPTPEAIPAPTLPPANPAPQPKTRVVEVPAGEIRLPQGARILRTTNVTEGPDLLKELLDHLKAQQIQYLKVGREKAKDPTLRIDPLLAVVESMGVTLDKEPVRRVRLGLAVNTYVMIREEKDGLVVRYYAQIPASFNNAAARLMEGFAHPIRVSQDSFVRPSGI